MKRPDIEQLRASGLYGEQVIKDLCDYILSLESVLRDCCDAVESVDMDDYLGYDTRVCEHCGGGAKADLSPVNAHNNPACACPFGRARALTQWAR